MTAINDQLLANRKRRIQMRKNTNFNLHVLIAFCLKNVIRDFRFAFRYRFRLNEIRIKSDWVWFFRVGWSTSANIVIFS